jgi:hypothetical protein
VLLLVPVLDLEERLLALDEQAEEDPSSTGLEGGGSGLGLLRSLSNVSKGSIFIIYPIYQVKSTMSVPNGP